MTDFGMGDALLNEKVLYKTLKYHGLLDDEEPQQEPRENTDEKKEGK